MIVLGGGPVGVRARPGLVDAGHEGHPGRGRRADPRPRGALRRRAGRRGAARASTASTSAPASAPSGSARGRPASSGRARRRRAARGGASCWSRSAAGRAPRRSASSRSGSSPARAASSRPTTGCGSAAASGSTRSATSTAGPSSPTWASTRPGSPPRTLLGREVEAIAEEHRLAPRHLHRPAGRRGRQDPRAGRRRPGSTPIAVDVATDGTRGRQLLRQGHRRHHPARRRPRPRRRSSAPPSPASRPPTSSTRRRRDRRRGAPRPPSPRGRRLPHPQRDLAQAAREVRARRGGLAFDWLGRRERGVLCTRATEDTASQTVERLLQVV